MEPLSLVRRISSGCGTSGVASCQNTSVETDTCCFEANGLIQQVQFWDTDPSTGPADSWTIHGLWPNYCDGSYPEDCDSSRDYDDISTLLSDQGASSTLDYMNTYWVSDDESNEDFWQHEWDTHGTCYTTLEPACIADDSTTGADAVAFFESVVSLFQTLPTYSWLEAGGITPSNDQTYTLDELQNAIQSAAGVTASFDCDDDELYQIEYWFNIKGSVIDGEWVPIDAYEAGSCRSSGIKYVPKSSGDDDDASRERRKRRRGRTARDL
ncbi:base non-specific and adenylic acid preferential ribonuclease [Wolfiporia cocos MD-104 SS10]|uniref:ribonuclease T2 n=1 Tax=Wolfiporia cocos (strain MD-104) TaxID=742152 RepID=A0A2H3J623_WOLCO|nr:base non-specific and adenylic acid preferential ribonuclease [Wolfiporia cocos MD-104 SS10]